MSEYTPEDFKNAGFAANLDGQRAIRMDGGHWRTSSAGLYPHAVLAREAGWRPVHEAAPLTLDTLREAWENAEQSEDCREGDTLIEFFAHGAYHFYPAAASYSSLPPAVRIHERAPQPEPWEALTKVLRTTGVDMQAMDPETLASVLYERGVRVTGGDDDE